MIPQKKRRSCRRFSPPLPAPAGFPKQRPWRPHTYRRGYTIQNQSSTDWLVTTDLNAGTFLHATPQAIFDFPDVAPGARVTLPYNPLTGAGLYEIPWDQNVPAGFVNSGAFILGAQWWSGNPGNGGTLIDVALMPVKLTWPASRQPRNPRLAL